MDVGMLEALVGGGVALLSTIGGLWLKQQQAMLEVMKTRNRLESPQPNGNGSNHTRTHVLLEQVVKSVDNNRHEFKEGFAELNKELRSLNDNLRTRPCIHE